MSLDIEHALNLLKICDLSRQWPNLKPLHDKAMKELEGDLGQSVLDKASSAAVQAQTALQAESSEHNRTKSALEKALADNEQLRAKVKELSPEETTSEPEKNTSLPKPGET